MKNYNPMIILSTFLVMSMMIAAVALPYKSSYFENGFSILWSMENKAAEIYPVNPIGEGNPWLYQLQNPDIDRIIESDYKHIIIDYSKDGTEGTAHTKEDIDKLNDNEVVALAYLSIGEAEDYRFYWRDAYEDSSWLGIENKYWPGNYKVRYWEKEWQEIIYTYLDKIIDAGYSGAYLDIVDGYYYWGNPDEFGELHKKGDPIDEADAAHRMINFISELSDYAKGKNPDFIMVGQNAVSILDYDTDKVYMNSIDGLGIESLWYSGIDLKEMEEIEERLQYIRNFFKQGKFVVVVDYIDDGSESMENTERIKDFIRKCKKEGYNYFVGNEDRALDVLK